MRSLLVLIVCLVTVFVVIGAFLIGGRELIEMVLPSGRAVGGG